MGNSALQSNPPNAQIDITTHASDWLWAVFALMVVSDLIMIGWSFSRIRGQRAFHHIAVAILTVTSIAYFAMASDLGSTGIITEFRRSGTRAIWYVRYIDWTITMPLLLLILLGTGLPLSDIFMAVFMVLVMIISRLIGALVASSYKWGFFIFSCAALIYIWYILLVPAHRSAGFLGANVARTYRRGSFFLAFLWGLYPIAWGLSEGGNVISPTGEMVFYGILDLLTKPVLCFLHVHQLSSIDYGAGSGGAGRYGGASTEKNGLRTGGANVTGHGAAGTTGGVQGTAPGTAAIA